MTITTTNLFSDAGIEALMITGSKAPRFELRRNGAVEKTIPATSAWRTEKLAVIAEAVELVASAPGTKIDTLLLGSAIPMSSTGAKPTRKATVMDVVANADGTRTISLRGADAASRKGELELLADWLELNFLAVERAGSKLIVAVGASFTPVEEPVAGGEAEIVNDGDLAA
jgi:hypothetical protein